MSLMQFLTVNRTFKGVNDGDSPYRVSEDVYLPKFNTEAEALPVAKPLARVTRPADADLFAAPAPIAVEPVLTREVLPPVAPKPAEPMSRPVVEAPVQPAAPVAKARTFSWRSQGKRPKAVVQGELSLDKVKVMRNDLADADLELVTVGPARNGQLGLAFGGQVAAPAAPTRFPWGRFVGRWFMSGRSRP